MKRKTKIIATIGPASGSEDMLKELILAGVNVCRINFSHGTHQENINVIKNIRKIENDLNTQVGILADLQGPKIRIGLMPEEGVELKKDNDFILDNNNTIGDSTRAFVAYKDLPKDVKINENILLDDGKISLKIISSDEQTTIKTRVVEGGILYSNKGLNLPNTKISTPSLSKKDIIDLNVALKYEVDWIGFSFVRSASDIIELKHIISNKNSQAKVIAKIEKPEALDNLDEILQETDGVMVARGDLGVEMPLETVPVIQKNIVYKARKLAKPVIIATQMMDSMIVNITPTRAEVNDVANAVMDQTDAVMLSGETSVGKNPIEVVKIMSKIINEVEENYQAVFTEEINAEKNHARFITDSICFNVCRLAKQTDAKAIVTMTHSGYTAYKISSQRPKASIFVFSGNRKLLNSLSLLWGVQTFYYDKMISTDHTIADIKFFLKKNKLINVGELIINTASIPLGEKGNTNMLKLSYIQ
jgi:pyruvate kinase